MPKRRYYGKDLRWLNWYINRGRIELVPATLQIGKRTLRQLSWRRPL